MGDGGRIIGGSVVARWITTAENGRTRTTRRRLLRRSAESFIEKCVAAGGAMRFTAD
jgi:hypothetical protein